MLAEAFADQHGLDRAAAKPAEIFRQRHGEPAELRHEGPVLGPVAEVGLHQLAPAFEVVFIAPPVLHAVGQQGLLTGKLEIHPFTSSFSVSLGYRPSTILAMM